MPRSTRTVPERGLGQGSSGLCQQTAETVGQGAGEEGAHCGVMGGTLVWGTLVWGVLRNKSRECSGAAVHRDCVGWQRAVCVQTRVGVSWQCG